MQKFYDVEIIDTDKNIEDVHSNEVLVISTKEEEDALKDELSGIAKIIVEFTTIKGEIISSNQILRRLERKLVNYVDKMKDSATQYKDSDEVYKYEELTFSDKVSLIQNVEFELILNDDYTFSLVDLQGGSLGNIESEVFYDIDSIIDRLEIYWQDYGIYFI